MRSTVLLVGFVAASVGVASACNKLAPFQADTNKVGPGHLAFLSEPNEGAPPRRTKAELDAVLEGTQPAPAFPDMFKVLLVAGPPDTDKTLGLGEHDFGSWQRAWMALLSGAPAISVQISKEWPSTASFSWADVIVFNGRNADWSEDRATQLDDFLAAGKGLVFIHFALDGVNGPKRLTDIAGLIWKRKQSRARKGPIDVSFAGARGHSIVRGFNGLHLTDETFFRLHGDITKVSVLASSVEEGGPQPLLWTATPKGGRVFASVLGHNNWTFNDPLFRVLLLRGISWAGKQHPERLTALAAVGVPLQ